MRRIFPHLLTLLSVVFCMSCLNDDDDNGVVYYSDTAVTSFTLGTLKRTMHTTSSAGADSTYTATFAGSSYKFYIDQLKGEIYNPDSLPQGTDTKHVLCTITSKNSGLITLKSVSSDTLSYYSSTDSIDFSQPRVVRVISNDGTAYRDYTVTLNVHQEKEDDFAWSLLFDGEANIATASRLRLAALGTHVFAVGQNDGGTFLTDLQAEHDGLASGYTLGADAASNVVARDGELLVLDGSTLHHFTLDASGNVVQTVETERNTANIRRLLGADGQTIYALGTDGALLASADNCLTWQTETTDADNAFIPTEDVSCMVLPSKTNADAHRMLLIGNRSADTWPAGAKALVWGKAVEPGVATQWYYIDQEESSFWLPRMKGLAAISYDNLILAAGGEGMGDSAEKAFSRIYVSQDGGINWRDDERFVLPSAFSSSNVFGMAVDAAGNIWMACGQSGQVWRGRLSQMGWQTEQKAFVD